VTILKGFSLDHSIEVQNGFLATGRSITEALESTAGRVATAFFTVVFAGATLPVATAVGGILVLNRGLCDTLAETSSVSLPVEDLEKLKQLEKVQVTVKDVPLYSHTKDPFYQSCVSRIKNGINPDEKSIGHAFIDLIKVVNQNDLRLALLRKVIKAYKDNLKELETCAQKIEQKKKGGEVSVLRIVAGTVKKGADAVAKESKRYLPAVLQDYFKDQDDKKTADPNQAEKPAVDPPSTTRRAG
jgi:hypothetical protein